MDLKGTRQMNVLVLCVGRLKEKYWTEACGEYLKRLSRYGKCQVTEVDDLPEPRGASPADQKKVMDREAELLLKHIAPSDQVICLCIRAPQTDSPGLAETIRLGDMAGRRQVFVIGGSLGLGEAVLARADRRLSMSDMTFPHQLARVMLLEQLYRAAKILSGERYHK